MIRIFVYDKATRLFKYSDVGLADYVIGDIKEGNDFTLTPYPLDGRSYKWNGKEWEAVDADNQSI